MTRVADFMNSEIVAGKQNAAAPAVVAAAPMIETPIDSNESLTLSALC